MIAVDDEQLNHEQVPAELTDEEVDALLAQYRSDFLFYCPRILQVLTMEGKIEPMKLNGPQRILHKIIGQIEQSGRMIRIIALKARRMGFSTYLSGRYYHRASWNHNRFVAQLTHEPEATDTLFKMVKRFYNFTPEWLRPQTLYNNTKLLEFNNKEGKGLGSGFRVATAGKDDFGSGQLIHYAHLCMAPDTPVLVGDGKEKPVKDVVPGDRVLTHSGGAGTVVAVSKKAAADLPDGGRMVVVHPWLGSPIVLTPQHKVWTNMGWVQAGDIDPIWHMVSMPIREITHGIKELPIAGKKSKYGPAYKGPTVFDLNKEAGFAVGYYLAEGCVSKAASESDIHQRITFTLHRDEDAFASRACAALLPFCKSPAKIAERKGTLTKTYTLDSGVLARLIYENFGGSDDKRIPDWVFDCGEDFCRGVVLGYLAGDGSKGIGGKHQDYENNSVAATSIRESITYQIRDIVAALGYGWGSVKAKPGGVFYGRFCRPAWTVHFNGDCGRRLREDIGIPFAATSGAAESGQRYRMDWNNRKVWLKIKKIGSSFCDEVFDLAIDHDDHSFRTPHFSISNSEVSKWQAENSESLLTSILQCVPDDPDTEVVFESTAKGIGGEFHDRFWQAKYRIWVRRLLPGATKDEGQILSADQLLERVVIAEEVNETADEFNIYTSVFLPWYCFERYQAKPYPGFEKDLTDAERKMQEDYGLTLAQLYWRRWTVANKCKGSVETFNQEYPSNPLHAFLGSGRPVFPNAKLLTQKEAAPKPIASYECMVGMMTWIAKDDGRLRVWKEPQYGRSYIISADVAEGLSKGDYSVADVIDHATGEQVAQWHGHVDADQFGVILICLGKRYNTALIAPERNNHGLTTVTVLVNENYPNIYSEMVPEPPGKPRKRYGWATTSTTRPLVIDTLTSEVREGTHGINCAGTLEEMMAFKIQDSGRMEADRGRHDDRVMCLAIGKFIRQVVPLPEPPQPKHVKTRSGGSTRSKPPTKGWT